MDPRKEWLAVVSIVMIAVILCGEVFTYSPGTERSSGTVWHPGSVDYSVSSTGSDVFSASLFSDCISLDAVYVYEDPDHDRYFDDACRMSERDPVHFDEAHMVGQVVKELRLRGIDAHAADASRLEEVVNESHPRSGIVVLSYSLPGSVYSGTDDGLIDWVKRGGMLYWMGSEVGRFYVTPDGLKEAENNLGLFGLPSGSVCKEKGIADVPSAGGFTDALRLRNPETLFGLSAGRQVGFCGGGFFSDTLFKLGSGTVAVIAGGNEFATVDDLCQIVASGVTADSLVLGTSSGKVVRGTVYGTFGFAPPGCGLYIFMGGTYQHYGAAYHV